VLARSRWRQELHHLHFSRKEASRSITASQPNAVNIARVELTTGRREHTLWSAETLTEGRRHDRFCVDDEVLHRAASSYPSDVQA